MSIQYMLDTNVLSSLIREPHGLVAGRVRGVGERYLCCSIVVAGEIQFGVENLGSSQLRKKVEDLLAVIDVLPLSSPAERNYAELRSHLKRLGTPIGANDLWIAAHALSTGLTLVTANIGEFQRVPGLSVENWEDE